MSSKNVFFIGVFMKNTGGRKKMIKASVEVINSNYVLLLSEEDSFEVVLLREWLPPDIDPGDR